MIGDRRKYPRRLELLRARVKTSAGEQSLFTTDVGPTGAFLASRDCPELGSRVEVYIRPVGIKLPPIRLDAEVVRCVGAGAAAQPGYGVRWLAATSEVGGEPLFRFLQLVLKIPSITRESIGNGRLLRYDFPAVGQTFATAAALPQQGPPVLRRTDDAPAPEFSRVTGRVSGPRVVSDAIGGRTRRDTMPSDAGGAGAAGPGDSGPRVGPRVPLQDDGMDTGRPSARPRAASRPAPDEVAGRGPQPSAGDRARFSRPVSLRAPSDPAPSQSGRLPTPATGASGWSGGRASARSSTSRRNSGLSQTDNVMAGAPVRRQSGLHGGSRGSARSTQPAPAQGTGRFSGVPQEPSARVDDVMPQRDLNSRANLSDSRVSGRSGGGRSAYAGDSPFAERSQLFGRTGADSTVGGRSIAGLQDVVADDDSGSVRVDVPVSYELDSRFHGAVMLAAAPLAVEISTLERPPQLEQQIIVNVPVERDGAYQTVYLQGKLLKSPERREDDVRFLLHVERVLEGKNEGAWTDFLSRARRGA